MFRFIGKLFSSLWNLSSGILLPVATALGKVVSALFDFLFVGILVICFLFLEQQHTPYSGDAPTQVKMLLPAGYGLVCQDNICVDNPEKITEAVSLYKAARNEVLEGGVSLGHYEPIFIFCDSEACFDDLHAPSERDRQINDQAESEGVITGGAYYPFVGAYINPQSWKHEVVLHELIHHVQAHHWLLESPFMPSWLTEGMAYHHTNKELNSLPEYLLGDVEQYREWVGDRTLQEALTASDEWAKENLHLPWHR